MVPGPVFGVDALDRVNTLDAVLARLHDVRLLLLCAAGGLTQDLHGMASTAPGSRGMLFEL